jgi:predicted ATPase/DNA-binding winged helix-turn-helix (wHTH) protein
LNAANDAARRTAAGFSQKNLKSPQAGRIVAGMVAGTDLPASVGFGRFRVLPHRREIIADGKPIKLGVRAFDILMALIEARGAVVTKTAVMARVWPGRIVEENNLQSHISALRAALGPDRDLVRTVSGHGYQFIGEIQAWSDGDDQRAGLGPEEVESGALPPTNVPEPVSELIGRDDELAEVVNLMGAHRLVTLTGAGGIGKTRLAVALARELRPHFADGVWLAQFSPLADPKLVPAAVASAVGLELGGEASAQSVAQGLAERRLLLVLDTCEHVIEVAASMAEAALRAGPELRILATSREPLRAEGEWIYSVPPLPVPTTDSERQDLFEYGAIRLFLERRRAADPRSVPNPPLVELIAAICRRLDGIPLAIELAAARAPALGVEGLAANLDDRFNLLTGGRRTALPRHQTLRATLDWSYALLDEPERILLRRLAVFAGTFDLDAVRVVVTGPELSALTAVDGITSLIMKSLVVTEGDGVAHYRLLDTTRAYAAEQLEESGERVPLALRHAEYYRDLFERAETEERTLPTAVWLARYGWQINDLRAALDWAFSPNGNAAIGTALTAAALPCWMHLSLLAESRDRVERALTVIGSGTSVDAARDMKLHAALGASLTFQRGAIEGVSTAYRRALEIAEHLNDGEYQLRSLWGLWVFHLLRAEWRLALQYAQRFAALAVDRPDPNDRAIADRLIGLSLHYLGDQANARRHIERMLTNFVPDAERSHPATLQFNQRVVARSMLARLLWLQGFPDQARRIVEMAVEDARATHAITMWGVLIFGACPVALWIGDLTALERYVEILLDYSTRYDLQFFRALGRCFQGLLLIKRGGTTSKVNALLADFDDALAEVDPIFYVMFLGEMAHALVRAGQATEGLSRLEPAINRSIRFEEAWLLGELLRVKGELSLLRAQEGDVPVAEDCFRQALDSAHRQGALSFELRAATSLARLLADQGRSVEAKTLLQPIYDRFTEGFDTADLKAAKTLLDAL